MSICPECGSIDYKVGITCCKTKEVICIDCCKQCSHYFRNEATQGHGCGYVAKGWHDEKSREQLQLNRIRSELDKKYEKMDYFYQTDRPYIAKRIEAEITRLRYEEQNIIASMADAV